MSAPQHQPPADGTWPGGPVPIQQHQSQAPTYYPPAGYYPPPVGYQMVPVYAPQPSNGEAVAALVLGIIGLLTSWIPLLGYILGGTCALLAIVLGAVGVNKSKRIGGHGASMAGVGMGLGILAVITMIAFIVAFTIQM